MGLACIGLAVSGDGGGSHIGLITLSGEINDEASGGFIPKGSMARDFIDQVDAAREDKSVKAVVIRVNSPGGSASASQEMYQAVMRLRSAKPVVCSMGDLAASGGYYVSSACDKIYANDSTLTGSIGVISEFMNYAQLAQKLGVATDVIKSGKFKDAGNPARPLTPEEQQLFQAMINDVYQQFVTDVVAGRAKATNGQLTRAKLLQIADGRVFTGHQAKAALLVDENGGLYDAIEYANKLAGLSGEPKVREVGGGGGLGGLLGSETSAGISGLAHDAGAAFAEGAYSQLKNESGAAPLEMR